MFVLGTSEDWGPRHCGLDEQTYWRTPPGLRHEVIHDRSQNSQAIARQESSTSSQAVGSNQSNSKAVTDGHSDSTGNNTGHSSSSARGGKWSVTTRRGPTTRTPTRIRNRQLILPVPRLSTRRVLQRELRQRTAQAPTNPRRTARSYVKKELSAPHTSLTSPTPPPRNTLAAASSSLNAAMESQDSLRFLAAALRVP